MKVHKQNAVRTHRGMEVKLQAGAQDLEGSPPPKKKSNSEVKLRVGRRVWIAMQLIFIFACYSTPTSSRGMVPPKTAIGHL